MHLLQLTSLSVSIDSATLLDSVNALVVDGDRIGLVGKNGCGKSTLMSLIAQDSHDDGITEAYWDITSGTITGPMAPLERDEGSVLLVSQDTLSWSDLFHGVLPESELREMSVTDAIDNALAEGLECAVEDEDTWRKLLNLTESSLSWCVPDYCNTPINELSPGSAFRAYLAIAIHRPDIKLLLLDEPTNHLDLPSILWLQHTIIASHKAFIIVSHDEAFLDGVTNHIWELDHDKHTLTVSGASYSAYKKAKLLAIEQQKRAYDMQQKRHQKLTAAADKLYKATKRGELFQSSDHDLLQRDYKRERAGRSGKKAAAVEKLRDAEEKVERVVEQKPLQIKFDPVSAGIDSAIILDDVVIGHDGQSIHLPPTTLRIDYGERIAIVGYNGIGKSTLLKTMTGEVDAVSGEVNIGRDLRMGNLMQEHETLSRAKITRDVIATQTGSDCFKGGSHVIGYGLSRRQIDQPIEELNPGARARLILAMFSMRRVNTLILDEPTNHLDEEAVVEVTGSLNTFEGTIVVVSHDREFLRTLNITRTFALTEYGLVEIDNIDDFVDEVCESVEAVVQGMFPGYNM